jgi:hypothetical protein
VECAVKSGETDYMCFVLRAACGFMDSNAQGSWVKPAESADDGHRRDQNSSGRSEDVVYLIERNFHVIHGIPSCGQLAGR